MGGLHQYLLSIVAASIVSALAIQIVGNKGTYSALIKLLVGIFLSITVISPIAKVRISDIPSHMEEFQAEADIAVSDGTAWANSELTTIIKQRSETYILDKATSIGAELAVDITLSDTEIPTPVAVDIQGKIGPYAKQRLQQIISDNLGIAKENQRWY